MTQLPLQSFVTVQLSGRIVDMLPKGFSGTYIEPFLGSGAVAWRILSGLGLKPAPLLSDANPELINFYQCLQSSRPAFYAALIFHQVSHNERHYYDVRKNYNSMTNDERAAAYLYIIRTGFNGLFRLNSSGECNTPFGKHYEFKPRINSLIKFSEFIRLFEFRCCDFEDALKDIPVDSFVYADPPYFEDDKRQFTQYTKEDFSKEDHIRLSFQLRLLTRQGIPWLLSASPSNFYRNLYFDCVFNDVSVRRSVSADGQCREVVKEHLIRNSSLYLSLGNS
jgi:DNA adenine methylase